MLQCAVPASRPIEELAATAAKEVWDSCVRGWDCVSMQDADLKLLLTASENLSRHFLSTSKTIICSFPAAWKAERTLFALAWVGLLESASRVAAKHMYLDFRSSLPIQ